MKKEKIKQLWNELLVSLRKLNWEKITSYASIICGIMAYVLFMFWYLGLILSIVALVNGIIHIKVYGSDRKSKVGIICGTLYIGFALLVLLLIGTYYSMIGLGRN